jgi:hypothetical protein
VLSLPHTNGWVVSTPAACVFMATDFSVQLMVIVQLVGA